MSNKNQFELKPCPFCGGQATLVKVQNRYNANPTTIKDEWSVKCENLCAYTPVFVDTIYHDETGQIVIQNDGAQEAIAHWNKRTN